MTAKPLPKPYKLARGVNKSVLTDAYKHWTVADVIEILSEYDPAARVWIEVRSGQVAPLEMLHGSDGEVFL